MFGNSFAFTVAWIWNALPEHAKELPSISAFQKKIKTFNFQSIDNTVVNTSLLYYKLIRQRFLRLTKKASLAIKVK